MLKCLQVTNTIDYLLVTDVEREGEGLSFVRWERSLSELFHTPMLVPAFTKNYWINPKYLVEKKDTCSFPPLSVMSKNVL
jgi:hypothetical protein